MRIMEYTSSTLISSTSVEGVTNSVSNTEVKKKTRRGGRCRKSFKPLLENTSPKIFPLVSDNSYAINNEIKGPNGSEIHFPNSLTHAPIIIPANNMKTFIPTSPVSSGPRYITTIPFNPLIPSSSNMVPLLQEKKGVSLIKKNSHPVKDVYYIKAANCVLQAFQQKKNRSKNIWKPPPIKKIKGLVFENSQLSQSEDAVTNDFHYDIQQIHNPSNGFFIRKRSSICKYINLKSFGSNIPVTFFSKFQIKLSDTTIDILNEKMDRINLHNSASHGNAENESFKEKRNSITGQKENSFSNKNKQDSSANIPVGSEVMKKQKKPKKLRIKTKTPKKKSEVVNYSEYIKEDEIEEGLNNGSLIKGLIRINQKNHRDAYVTNIVKGDVDYIIKSVIDQNRALDGDEVILKVNPETEWDEGRKTAVVVYISKMIHSRTSVGKLLSLPKNDNFAMFLPRDPRFPSVQVPVISWPQGFKSDPRKFAKNLFVAKITEWTSPECAKGLIIENVGMSGDLKIENLAILKTCGLDHEPFSNNLLKDLPKLDFLEDTWFEGREDLRKECIFSIDPLTARDLDDAVSCKTLPDGNLEVGVHIADVSFFLKEGTELDKQVAWKATTIYMTDKVYHMLPVELCMNCSLLPAKDKLSFSVFWKMTPEGEILSTRFAKSVMNSCVQLAYEHAQAIIDDPEKFDISSFPKIANGYSIDHIREIILKLYHISKNLRKKRFDNGALRIDQMKISFNLDPETGFPTSYYCQAQTEANRLIEEFMLLANISVAEKIYEYFPEIAFLRLHEPPKESMMTELKNSLESVGIHVDITSAKSIQISLQKYSSNDLPGKIRGVVLNHLFAKPMTRARYFCPAVEKTGVSYGHYALNIPLYTHFTSPIRRYADVIVHRLLEASLGISQAPTWDPLFVSEVANRCNILKYNAKKAQEESTRLYLSLYISKHGPFIRDAAVVDVKERSFDVIVLECGEIVRVYLNDIEGVISKVEEIPSTDLSPITNKKEHQKKSWKIQLSYLPTKNEAAVNITIELFSLVKIELRRCPKKEKLRAKLLRPNF